jgi:hypothetical protein
MPELFSSKSGLTRTATRTCPAGFLADGGQFGDFAEGFDVDQDAGGDGLTQLFVTVCQGRQS